MTTSMSSSGVSSCYSEIDLDRLNENESDEEDAFISFTTTESKCEQLYQEGLELKHQGDLENSLSSFLKCLEGMQECQYFVKLPQTLQQLSVLSRSLHDFQRAEEYEEAEKLFYKVTVVQSSPQPQAKEGGAKHKKRRPFSKKPKPAVAVCNPADYGNVLTRKAGEFDKLARICAKENKFSDALDHSNNALRIRRCVFGQNHHLTVASVDSLRALHTEASIYEASVTDYSPLGSHLPESKGDLSLNGPNGSPQSVVCEVAQTSLSATALSDNDIPQYGNTTGLLPSKDCSTQTDTVTPHIGDCTIIPPTQEGSVEERSFPTLYSSVTPVVGDAYKSDKDKGSDRQECAYTSIHKDSRQDGVQWGNQLNGALGKSQEIVCVGVKSNLSKLSELKNPMCVNLDLHKGPGEGTENTRCLPLWVLLLPAFLALVAYYSFYYH